MSNSPPPRLYAILAAKAPVALVFRRGPSRWWHLLRWHLDDGRLEHGAWVKKNVYPRRWDLSPDGKLTCFYLSGAFANEHQSTRRYDVVAGVSRTPWLHPIDSWTEGDTWGRGWFFTDNEAVSAGDEQFSFQIGRQARSIRRNGIVSFLNERRRGWREAPDSPVRDTDDMWDERRRVILQKPCPTGGYTLRLRDQPGKGIDYHSPAFDVRQPDGTFRPFDNAAWADWAPNGNLLVATVDGFLRMHDPNHDDASPIVEHDLRSLTPDPQPAPEWAQES